MEKLTAIIPAGNEEENIKAAVESLLWADEVLVVVDEASSDRTFEIAACFGGKVRVEKHEYVYSALQKNWAIPRAKHEWIFLLDCDERPDEKLVESIKKTLEKPKCDAYEVKRRNFFLGKILRYGGLSNDKVVRLFRRELRYEDKRVHAEIKGFKNLGELKGFLVHHTFKDWDSYLKKLDRYAIWGAEQALMNNQKAGLINILLRPLHRFFKQYFLRLGFLDGIPGAVNASLGAYSVFLKYSILYHLKMKSNSEKEMGKK
jgi:glycosyltransferase involved in cell wall biosynthesis